MSCNTSSPLIIKKSVVSHLLPLPDPGYASAETELINLLEELPCSSLLKEEKSSFFYLLSGAVTAGMTSLKK